MFELKAKYNNQNIYLKLNNGLIDSSWNILDSNKRYVVITDTNLANIYHQKLKAIPNGIAVLTVKINDKTNTLSVYEKIINNLYQLNFQKDDVLIAFGGQSICNLTSFIAKTYLNGVEYISIPTSLVAQAYGALGGKISLFVDNNPIISLINHPIMTFIDPLLLNSLPQDQFELGIIHIIKLGFLKDNKILSTLLKEKIDISNNQLRDIIINSIIVKNTILNKHVIDHISIDLLTFGEKHQISLRRELINKLNDKEILMFGIYDELNDSLKNKFINILEINKIMFDLEKYNNYYKKLLAKKDKKIIYPYLSNIKLEKSGHASISKE